MESLTIRTEHKWLTVRTETGWLLWSAKVSDITEKGCDFTGIIKEIEQNYAEWKREQAIDEAEDRNPSIIT